MQVGALLTSAVAVILISTATAAAQTIGVAATLGMKRFSGEPDNNVLDTTSGGVLVTMAAPVSAHTSVHLEIGIERPGTRTKTTTIQQGRLETDYTNKMRTVSLLAAVHPFVRSRIRTSVFGGLTFVSFTRTVALRASAPGSVVPPAPSVFVDRTGAASVGGELEWFVSPHLALVPGIRAHSFSLASDLSGFTIQASAGVKYAF